MRRLAAILLLLLLLLAPLRASAATQTCIVVTVRDQGGAGIPNVVVMRDGGNAKHTDRSGATLWCVAVSQTSTQLTIEGMIVSATATGGTASLQNNTAYIAWLKGTDPVAVTIIASAGGATPTPSSTPAPTRTPRPTATPGPSPTPIPTPTPWDGWYDASAIVEIEPGSPPGRYNFRVIEGGGVEVYMQTHEGGDYPSSCGTDCTSAFGWTRLFFRCDYTCPECPPPMPQATCNFTPKPETATPTISASATQPPDAATWCLDDAISLDDGAAMFKEWARINYSTDPYVIMELGR